MFVLQLIWLIKGIMFYPDEAPRDLDEQMFTDFTKLLIGHTDKFIKIFMSFEYKSKKFGGEGQVIYEENKKQRTQNGDLGDTQENVK